MQLLLEVQHNRNILLTIAVFVVASYFPAMAFAAGSPTFTGDWGGARTDLAPA